MRTTAILTTLVLSAGVLAGCGSGGGSSSSTSAYCKDLKAAKADFATFDSSSPDFDKLDDAINTFHKIAGDAPSAVSAEWKTLDDALSGLQNDLKALGLSLKDLGPITQGQLPPGMTAQDLATIAPKLQATFTKLSDDKFKKASDKIEKHAKSACGIDLSNS
jgi:hypothetical protein